MVGIWWWLVVPHLWHCVLGHGLFLLRTLPIIASFGSQDSSTARSRCVPALGIMERCRGFLNPGVHHGSGSDQEDFDGSQDFLPICAVNDHLLSWQPANGRVSLASVLSVPTSAVSGFAADGSSPTLPDLPQAWDPESLDPLNLLRRALREHHPELYVPSPGIVRKCSTKQKAPLGSLLRRLQVDPLCMGYRRLTTAELQVAKDEFVRRYALASGEQLVAVRAASKVMFSDMCHAQRAAWHVVAQVARVMYESRRGRSRQLLPVPQGPCIPDTSSTTGQGRGLPLSFEAFGLILTWNVLVGLDDPTVREIFQRETGLCAQVAALKGLPSHQWHFHAFRGFIHRLSIDYGFLSWAACMELSRSAETPGRVHLHAFLGPNTRGNGAFGGSGVHKISVETKSLVWQDRTADISLMQLRSRRQVGQSVAGGMYYVMANKEGSLFRAGSAQPFLDPHSLLCFIPKPRVNHHPSFMAMQNICTMMAFYDMGDVWVVPMYCHGCMCSCM